MLGQMVGVKSGAIVGFGDLETILVVVRKRYAVAVEMVENAEFHFCLARGAAELRLYF